MNHEEAPKHDPQKWCAKQAALAATISQEQLDCVLWVLGYPVGGTVGYTPADFVSFWAHRAAQKDMP